MTDRELLEAMDEMVNGFDTTIMDALTAAQARMRADLVQQIFAPNPLFERLMGRH